MRSCEVIYTICVTIFWINNTGSNWIWDKNWVQFDEQHVRLFLLLTVFSSLFRCITGEADIFNLHWVCTGMNNYVRSLSKFVQNPPIPILTSIFFSENTPGIINNNLNNFTQVNIHFYISKHTSLHVWHRKLPMHVVSLAFVDIN